MQYTDKKNVVRASDAFNYLWFVDPNDGAGVIRSIPHGLNQSILSKKEFNFMEIIADENKMLDILQKRYFVFPCDWFSESSRSLWFD